MKPELTIEEFMLDSYGYELPPDLIATEPCLERTSSRLLVLQRDGGAIKETDFKGILGFLKEGDLLVVNDSKVIKARLFGKKRSGGKVEFLLVRPKIAGAAGYEIDSGEWETLINPAKNVMAGDEFELDGAKLKVIKRLEDGMFEVSLSIEGGVGIMEYLEKKGHVPLPPYIERARKLGGKELHMEKDASRYQTVYARPAGSVAAPTAGLHFDGDLIEKLKEKGVRFAGVTLHVGPGTFRPVKVGDVREHRMEREWYNIPASAVKELLEAKERGGRVIAVGTTSVRVLESFYINDMRNNCGFTELFIYPGFKFRCVDGMVTNFHLPKSTLLLLVSAFGGRENIMKAYSYAVTNKFRFYSYGDAMLIL